MLDALLTLWVQAEDVTQKMLLELNHGRHLAWNVQSVLLVVSVLLLSLLIVLAIINLAGT